ncbi:MAG: hypothetical protein ACRD2G_00475, partial [Terriglobia bacterium]
PMGVPLGWKLKAENGHRFEPKLAETGQYEATLAYHPRCRKAGECFDRDSICGHERQRWGRP